MEKGLILGIDSSLSCTGWSILTNSTKPKLIDYGKIITEKNKDLSEDEDLMSRYKIIQSIISDLFQKHDIKHVVMEQPNMSRNMKVTRKLIGIYQILRFFIFLRQGILVREINTKTLKKSVTGNGGAEKIEVIRAINKIFNKNFQFHKTNKQITEDDICDSIGAALTFIKMEFK